MKKLLHAIALATVAVTSQANLAAQQIDSKVSQRVESQMTVEPWMYPVQIPATPTVAQLNSIIRKPVSLETEKHKGLVQTGTTVTVPTDIAAFDEIMKWYATKLNDTDILLSLNTFNETNNQGAKSRDGFSKSFAAEFVALTRFRFTTDQKLMTTLVSLDGGETVSVMLVGNGKETSIFLMRHHTHHAGG